MLRIAVIAAAALAATTAFAAEPVRVTPHSMPPDGFKYMPAKDVDALTGQPGPGPHTAYAADHENFFVEYASRNDSANLAELHAHWTHYIHILSGEATLTYGGTIHNAKDTAPGQVRGDAITGGKTVQVHPGDYIQIPAGTPHMFNPPKGGKLHYVVFNIRG